MNILNSNCINILALPDELLRAILDKLEMVDVLYSMVDVNQRFDRLALDSLYIDHLDFVVKPLLKRYSSSVNHQVLDQICRKILPRIHYKISKLTVEPLSMERVLGIANYPQLHSLSLVNFPTETLLSYLIGNITLVRLLTDQITQLDVDTYVETSESSDENEQNIFAIILSLGKHLSALSFSQYFLKNPLMKSISNLPRTSCVSSILTKLNISVHSFDDCLYLLDGRFECLSTLVIKIRATLDSLSDKENTVKKLPKLKCFSLTATGCTFFYDDQFAPLLRRMSDLEELTLFLSVFKFDSTYIDGKQLYDNVLSHMARIKKFTFNIHTHIINDNVKIDLPSNNDIRNSFIERGYKHVDAFADEKLVNNRGGCHVYSLPYQFKDFVYMTNSFQGGKFDQVQRLIMYDRRAFEHELFQIIARDFPFLQTLIITNLESQQFKRHSFTCITFNHLCELAFRNAHIDYAIEFLFDRNIRLPRLTNLSITYEALATVTNSFTNDETRLNCNRITCLDLYGPFVRPENFHLYFPFF